MTDPGQGGSSDHKSNQNSVRRTIVDQIKRFGGWLLALVSLVIITLVKSYLAEVVWPGRKLAMMDSTLTRAWNYSDSVAQNKALVDLSDDAKTNRFQMHLIGRLAVLVRNSRRLQNANCPSSPKPLGTNDQLAVAIIVQLGRELGHPHNRLYFFHEGAPPDLPDSLRFDSVDFSLAHFDSANLRRANFSKSCLFKASFEGANLDSSEFSNARLDSTDFRGARMHGAQLRSSGSRGATFRDAILVGANLNFMRLRSVNFAGADLSCAYFANAVTDSIELSGAALPWTLLFATKLDRVQSWEEIDSLKGAYLVGVVGLRPREVAHALDRGAYLKGLDQVQWGRLRDRNCQFPPKDSGGAVTMPISRD
jgi:hypothetical protein